MIDAIDSLVADELERTRQPGLALGVTDRDATLTVRTYGYADVAAQRPVTPGTLFEIGSIGKTFTSLAVLQLVGEGRIELDAPVSRYLPWFTVPQPDGAVPIAIAHLLSHTAGIVAGIDATPEAAFQVWTLRDLPARSAPGERFHYSNVGYKALGLVLEAVESRRYPDVIRTRILVPLGMSATEPEITHDIRERLAVGYEHLFDDRPAGPDAPLAPATWLETATADGSIASTAEDMCALVRLLLRRGEGLISEESFARMSTGYGRVNGSIEYGFGLTMREQDGARFIGHAGGMVGYLAGLQADPDAGLGAIVLQNGPSANPMMLARAAVAIAREGPGWQPAPAAPRDEAPAPTPDEELPPITGRYRSHNPWTTNFQVVARAGRPWLVFASTPDSFEDEAPLAPLPDGGFRVGDDPQNPETLRFDTEVDGRTLRAWLSGWPYYRV
jgi:CubicO group peptidase (beta-lactamase class C family)